MSPLVGRTKTRNTARLSTTPSPIRWHFPPTGGGVSQGFHDSGQEFFKAGVMEHMVREIIQNSLDAHDLRYLDKPVVVRMERLELTPDMIGGTSLKPHVKSSLEYMKNGNDTQGVKFYKDALNMLKGKTIPVLAITDENTTGLTDNKWDALIYKEGTPNKEGQAAPGGSYGIGKNAPYAASKLSLVCYSTRYLNRHRTEKFIARCRLVAHPDPSDHEKELQHVGFGNSESLKNSRFPPIVGNVIHKKFRLPRNGSGIFIVGFVEPDWEEAAKRSIARNFFTAIHEKKLQVVVNGEKITNETLNGLDFGDGSYRDYYKIVKRTARPFRINGRFGSFELKVATGEEITENRVAYINRRGMLITEKKSFKENPFHVRLGGFGKFVAVIRAADDRTDVRVRQMEPPTHEAIEYERISERAKRNETKSGLMEVQKKITDHIKAKLNVDLRDKRTELTELADILPLVSNADMGGRHDGSGTEPNENIEHKQLPIPNPKSSTVDDGMDGAGGSVESGGQEKNGTGAKSTQRKKRAKKSTAASTMGDIRVMRHADTLRVAFTPKERNTRFAVKPAGEESKPEDVIPITAVKTISADCKTAALNGDTMTVRAKRNKRVILDISINQGETYTGYEVVEYETGGGRQ